MIAACSSRSSEPTTPVATLPPAPDVDASVSSLSNDPSLTSPPTQPITAPVVVAPVTITAGERRATPTPSPRVAIRAPANNSTAREGRVEVRLNVTNWRNVTDTNDHRHIHLVLDNEAYRRVDDPTRPVVLENLAEGTHVLRAFPGWETHETVKADGAFAMVVFHVGRPTQGWAFNTRAPLLTYSRPKGAVNGADADRMLLDFYLTNVPAADLGAQGVRVRPTIDGHAMDDLPAWVPYYIEHLTDGEHTVALDLIGRDGQPLAGPFNHAEQRITVSHAAPADTHAHPEATPPAGDAGAPATAH